MINNEAFPKKKNKKPNNMGIKTSLKMESKNPLSVKKHTITYGKNKYASQTKTG